MDVLNEKIMNSDIKLIENYIDNYIFTDKSILSNINEAMKYSLSAGGKRIRPVLVMEFCRLCGKNPDGFVDIASTIEMVHTFSLIHDDLPCMDDDDYRRGKLSCHKKYGEAVALLAGDALCTFPFEIISKAALNGQISFEMAIKLINEISSAIGCCGMIGGQIIDIECEHKKPDLETLKLLQSLKTGALIKCACKMGCILAEADDKMFKIAEDYAENIGLAFQIIDDVLDVTSTFEELGKPIGSDKEMDKTTYVNYLGVDGCLQKAKSLTENAIKSLDGLENTDFLVDLADSLLKRNK